MLIRTISGACYLALLTAFFLLRQFVNVAIFDLFTYFICIMGTFEVARAVKNKSFKCTFGLSIICAVLLTPTFLLANHFLGLGQVFSLVLVALFVLAIAIFALIKKTNFSTFTYSVLPILYPSIFLLFMLSANHLLNGLGFLALLSAFVISPASDTFAYLVGSRVGGKKLCPKLSPKKTWSGAIGGTIGGIVSSLILYFIFKPEIAFFSPVLLFIVLGFIGSIITVFGDLFESFIKRKVGIKDMGKIMPGHGGVMDRIDGTVFLIIFTYVVFLLV